MNNGHPKISVSNLLCAAEKREGSRIWNYCSFLSISFSPFFFLSLSLSLFSLSFSCFSFSFFIAILMQEKRRKEEMKHRGSVSPSSSSSSSHKHKKDGDKLKLRDIENKVKDPKVCWFFKSVMAISSYLWTPSWRKTLITKTRKCVNYIYSAKYR